MRRAFRRPSLAAPVIALGGSPLLAYNVVFILSFVLSGVGAYLLAEEVSGSAGALSWPASLSPSAPTSGSTSSTCSR